MNGTTGAISMGFLLLSCVDRKGALKSEFERVAISQISHLYKSAFYLTRNKARPRAVPRDFFLVP